MRDMGQNGDCVLSYSVDGVYTIGDEVRVKTATGAVVTLGKQKFGYCCYETCRIRNLCKRDHCVGAVLLEHGYRVEAGMLCYEF